MTDFPGHVPGQPPGHIPGVHLPGTLIPIGAVVEQRRREEQAAYEREQSKSKSRRANLLLTLGND
jgi:hypothetical protein